jgi:transcriptional regulator with XRE-family HTH domain
MGKLKSPIDLHIVNEVKLKRKAMKLNQKMIAKAIGVTDGYIGQIESLKSPSMYSYDQLNELAKFFECSPKDFMPEEAVE